MEYYSTKQLAEKLTCSPKFIRDLIGKGELKAMRLGARRFIITDESLEKYLNRRITPNFSRGR